MPEVIIPGPAGRLEGRLCVSSRPRAPIALVLHPDPLHGGTMHNKVTYALFRAFEEHRFSVLRFNFRGVGRSQGGCSDGAEDGQAELADAAVALDWLQNTCTSARSCWVAGFSFGAWISLQMLMRRPEIVSFIAVAPPAGQGQKDFSFLAPCPACGLFVQGEKDEIVPANSVRQLARHLSRVRGVTVQYKQIEGANHLFGGCLTELEEAVRAYLGSRRSLIWDSVVS